MDKLLLSIALIVVMAFSSGCGIAAKVRARDDMENSKAAYKKCLQQNADDLSKCEGLRRAYEADLKAYRATSKRVNPNSISIEKDE